MGHFESFPLRYKKLHSSNIQILTVTWMTKINGLAKSNDYIQKLCRVVKVIRCIVLENTEKICKFLRGSFPASDRLLLLNLYRGFWETMDRKSVQLEGTWVRIWRTNAWKRRCSSRNVLTSEAVCNGKGKDYRARSSVQWSFMSTTKRGESLFLSGKWGKRLMANICSK